MYGGAGCVVHRSAGGRPAHEFQSGEGTKQEVPREMVIKYFRYTRHDHKNHAGFIKIIFMIIPGTWNNIKEMNMKV